MRSARIAIPKFAMLMLVTATLLFYLKPSTKDSGGADGEGDDFDSILATMYLTIMMLTGMWSKA